MKPPTSNGAHPMTTPKIEFLPDSCVIEYDDQKVSIPLPVVDALYRELLRRSYSGIVGAVRRLASLPDDALVTAWKNTCSQHFLAGVIVGQKEPDVEAITLIDKALAVSGSISAARKAKKTKPAKAKRGKR